MTKFIVEIEPGVFLAPIEGDPGRTLVSENAKVFESHKKARIALLCAQKVRPFKIARVTLAPLHNVELSGSTASSASPVPTPC